jgi:ABC-type uncharacterized transport system YnjBCD ATPase subunit
MLTYVKIFEEEKAGKDLKVLAGGKKGTTAERTKLLSKPRYLCMTGNLNALRLNLRDNGRGRDKADSRD